VLEPGVRRLCPRSCPKGPARPPRTAPALVPPPAADLVPLPGADLVPPPGAGLVPPSRPVPGSRLQARVRLRLPIPARARWVLSRGERATPVPETTTLGLAREVWRSLRTRRRLGEPPQTPASPGSSLRRPRPPYLRPTRGRWRRWRRSGVVYGGVRAWRRQSGIGRERAPARAEASRPGHFRASTPTSP
jgi:hypothetical protein